MKKLQFVKNKCQCGHVNLVPVTKTFHVYENIKCEKCGKGFWQNQKEPIDFWKTQKIYHD